MLWRGNAVAALHVERGPAVLRVAAVGRDVPRLPDVLRGVQRREQQRLLLRPRQLVLRGARGERQGTVLPDRDQMLRGQEHRVLPGGRGMRHRHRAVRPAVHPRRDGLPAATAHHRAVHQVPEDASAHNRMPDGCPHHYHHGMPHGCPHYHHAGSHNDGVPDGRSDTRPHDRMSHGCPYHHDTRPHNRVPHGCPHYDLRSNHDGMPDGRSDHDDGMPDDDTAAYHD